jgi:excisionase family DNA binding protein
MTKLIDFSNYKNNMEVPAKRVDTSPTEYIQPTIGISDEEFKLTINILLHNHPDKISFTIEEVATYIHKSKEFIRRRIKSGRIKATYFGDGPMVHISELARLLTQGIK